MRELSQSRQHLIEGIRGMGVIDKDRRTKRRLHRGGRYSLQTSRRPKRLLQHGGQGRCRYPEGQPDSHHRLQIGDIKIPYQRGRKLHNTCGNMEGQGRGAQS